MQHLYCILLGVCVLTSVSTNPRLHASEEPAGPPPAETGKPLPPPPPTLDPREEALAALAEAAATGSLASDRLLDLAADPSAPLDLRNRAVLALAKVGLNDPQQAERLFRLLPSADVHFDLRWTILMAFSSHAQWQDQLRPILLQIAADETQLLSIRQQSWQNLRQRPRLPEIRKAAIQFLGTHTVPIELQLAGLDLLKSGPEPAITEIEELARIAVNPATPANLQSSILQALASWQATARPAIPILVTEVANPDATAETRLESMRTLSAIGDIGPVTAYLAPILLQTNAPAALRQAIARLPELRNQQLPGTPADWARITLDDAQPLPARQLTLLALSSSSPSSPDSQAAETCRLLLLQPQKDLSLRLLAADYLQTQPPGDKQAWTSVLERAEDPNETEKLRLAALATLASQSRHWIAKPGNLKRAQLLENLQNLELLVQRIQTLVPDIPDSQTALDTILQNQSLLMVEWKARPWDRFVHFVTEHPVQTILIGVVLIIAGTYTTRKTRHLLNQSRAASSPPLVQQEPPPPPAIPPEIQSLLNQLLATDNPERSSVIDKLRAQAPQLDPAIPQLLDALQNHALDLDVRYAALTTLSLLNQLPDHGTHAIAQAAENSDDPVFFRLKALEIAIHNTRKPAALKTALARHIANTGESSLIRCRAGELLLKLGSLPADVRADLQKAAQAKPTPDLQPILEKLLN